MTTDIETRIRKAYRKLAKGQSVHAAVRLHDLRQAVAATTRQMDKALTEMARMPGVHIHAEPDQKSLTGWDHFSALTLGGTARHIIYIDG